MNFKKTIPFVVILAIAALYFLGLAAVPFHPDESTQIFMSSDVARVFTHPSELFFTASPKDPQRQNYRLLDAPLSRWLIGTGRLLAGEPSLTADWSWSQTWQQNQAAGALPTPSLLFVSRLSVACLFVLTLYFGYGTGVAIGGTSMGWLMIGLVSINALILLHTRRAMAESTLMFTVTWFAYAVAKKETNPLLLVLPAALAVNAKQTAAGLAIVALMAIWIYSCSQDWHKRLRNVVMGAAIIVFVTYLLNPVAWKNPMAAAQAAIQARSKLAAQQTEVIGTVSPDLLLRSPTQRLAGWLVYLYLSEPAAADVANYVNDTRASELAYFSNPLHNLFRGVIGGILMLVLSLFGFLFAAYKAVKSTPSRKPLVLLLLATLTCLLTLVLFIPLPFQRYSVLLLPFSTLWAAFLLNALLTRLIKTREA